MSLWQDGFVRPLREVQDESRAYLSTPEARAADRKVMIVLLVAAICLTLQEYCISGPRAYSAVARLLESFGQAGLAGRLLAALHGPGEGRLHRLEFYAVGCLVVQFLIPALVVKLILRERLSDYGLKLRGLLSGFWTYAVMMAVVVPLVVLVSTGQRFQATHPYYRLSPGEPLWPNFWTWKAVHAVQFLGLEFLFRGFLVHGTRHRFGCYSVFVMMVPYCMIHFAKPLPETLASIDAALGLGFMSLKTRSIWMGTALHASVALTMDLASLWRQGWLGAC